MSRTFSSMLRRQALHRYTCTENKVFKGTVYYGQFCTEQVISVRQRSKYFFIYYNKYVITTSRVFF